MGQRSRFQNLGPYPQRTHGHATYDRMLLFGSHLSAGPTIFNRALRDLLQAPEAPTTPRGFITYSPITHQPIACTLAYDPDDNAELVALQADTSPPAASLAGRGYARTFARPARR